MTKILAQKLILALTALHCAVVGAGFGERVLYFGGDHPQPACGDTEHRHESESHDHEHGCGNPAETDHHHHVALLHFLPFALPIGDEHGNHHESGCEHIHLNGVDAAAKNQRELVIAAPAPDPWPVRWERHEPRPVLLPRACEFVDAAERPPDRGIDTTRLLI